MNRSDSVKELATALAKAQGELQNPKFDTQNPFFKSRYASLAAVRDTVIPVFSKNGLSIVQSLRSTEKGVECETMLMHLSGEWISDTLSMPISKHDAQGYGSAGTYARRYSLMAFSGVVGDSDDDANAASEVGAKKRKDQPAGGQAPDAPLPQSGAPGGVVETRTETMTRLCKEAALDMAQCLAKVEVKSAEEMAEDDWASFVRMAKKKIGSK